MFKPNITAKQKKKKKKREKRKKKKKKKIWTSGLSRSTTIYQFAYTHNQERATVID